MNDEDRINQIGDFLKDQIEDKIEILGVPICNEKELDSIFDDIRNQNYNRYNELFEKLQSSKVSAEYLKSIFKGIVDMVVLLKPDGTIFKTNSKLLETLGYKEESLLGSSFNKLISKGCGKHIDKTNEILNNNGFINNIEQIFISKEGKEIPVLSSASLLYDNGQTDAILYIVKDISKIKEVEKQLRTKNEELNTFVYKASHDIKGPLASIQGLVTLAKSEIHSPKEVELYIDLIGRSVNRLDYTLCELLEFTKIGQGSLNYSLISFKSLLRAIIGNLDHLDNYKGLEIKMEIEGDSEFVSDETVLKSVLHNLIQNAVNFRRMDIKNSFISVNINVGEENAIIELADNGEGMGEDVIDNIFKMFYRGSEKTEGSGLGLYIVKIGLEKIEGEIEVTSSPNKGSTFSLTVPNLTSSFRSEMSKFQIKP